MEKAALLAGDWPAQAAIPPAPDDGLAPDLAIVLVCWNNKSYLKACLESLYAKPMHCRFDVIVVDNGSTDGSQQMIATEFPAVRLQQNTENVGLGKASNQGIVATSGRYVLLLNNDTLVNGPALDALVAFLDNTPQAGAVGGRVLNADGTVQSCYNHFSTLWEEFLIATRLSRFIAETYPAVLKADTTQQVDWITSACLLLRRRALADIGLLDEAYFIYGDEVDLQYRLKKAGWQTYYLPLDTIIHFGGRSMNRWSRRKMVYRGKILFYQKHYGPIRTGVLRSLLGGLSLAKLLFWVLHSIVPHHREEVRKEIQSNIDVVKLCYHLE
ncbi:MAG: glycosyltransferase family 2 protein [Caldilinea sp. CFX5]|nr:glycosyltransferase family 2 protein [Caldilinea sp. CFX5]